LVPTKSFATLGGIIEINLLALTNAASRRKQVVAADIPDTARHAGAGDDADRRFLDCCSLVRLKNRTCRSCCLPDRSRFLSLLHRRLPISFYLLSLRRAGWGDSAMSRARTTGAVPALTIK
jgi:hypothetical protein